MLKSKTMREMTAKEYFYHSVMREVIKDAEKEGIKIVDVKSRASRPRLITDRGVVVPLQGTTTDGP
jgi:hypothetical protein